MKWISTAAALIAVCPAIAAGQVTTVAYEGFDYLKGGCVAGAATGIGWASPWGEAGEGGNVQSEWIIGPGSFPVPSSYPANSGQHIDLNQATGERRITRALTTPLGLTPALVENVFSFTIDFGFANGVDYAGVELANSAGGPVVYIGKPSGSGPSNAGVIGMDIYGQGFTSTGVAGTGQKSISLRWSRNASGPETMTLLVQDAATGALLGSTSQTAEVTFDRITLIARRDLAAGGSIPAFDEIRATTEPIQTRTLTVASTDPSSGVPITISPADVNGSATGNTGLQRVYVYGASVTLTAPATMGSNGFRKWVLDGADLSTRRTVTVVMGGDHALTAEFVPPAQPTYALSVSASGPSSPVTIAVSPADQNGAMDGPTPFTRTFAQGATVSLTAPSVAGFNFTRWSQEGATLSTTTQASIVMTTAIAVTAEYAAQPPEFPYDEKISNLAISQNGVTLTWDCIGGRSYIMQASADLIEAFHDISAPLSASGTGRTTRRMSSGW